MSQSDFVNQEPGSVQDTCTYRIDVQGELDARGLSACGPLELVVVEASPAVTLLAVLADQAAVIGLLRYLHQRGLVVLSVSRT